MKLCFTHTSLAARDFSGDPGSEGLKKCHKSLSIPGHQIDRAETWFQTLFQKLPWISVHFSSDCQWWLTMESNLTKTTEVFSPGFLCKFKKIKLKKKSVSFLVFFPLPKNENVRTRRCYSAPQLSPPCWKRAFKADVLMPFTGWPGQVCRFIYMMGVRMMLCVWETQALEKYYHWHY